MIVDDLWLFFLIAVIYEPVWNACQFLTRSPVCKAQSWCANSPIWCTRKIVEYELLNYGPRQACPESNLNPNKISKVG